MSIFTVILGASRIEFSVVFERNKYVGRVNDIVVAENVDFESVRTVILSDMEPTSIPSKLH